MASTFMVCNFVLFNMFQMAVPYFALDRFFKNNAAALSALFGRVGESGRFISGPFTENFEKILASYSGHDYAVAVSSCTDALFFALKAAGVKEGDEVIVPSFSFIATVTPVVQAGAVPVFTDILPETLSMCPDDFKRKITSRTKAAIFVHLYGAACPVDDITQTAKNHSIILIEDNAQALGCKPLLGTVPGHAGMLSCVSFDPTKVIGAFGTGGALITSDAHYAQHVAMLRSQGKSPRSGNYDVQGFNSRISEFQAAFLLYQMEVIDSLIEKRRKIAKIYNEAVAGNPLLTVPENHYSTFHKYVVITKHRNQLRTFLKERGIETMIHYDKPLFEHAFFKDVKFRAENLTTVHECSSNVVSLPLYPEMYPEEIECVRSALVEFSV